MNLEGMDRLLRVLLDSSIRSLAVAVAIGLVLFVARIRSNHVRHWAWSGVLAAMLFMPLLAWLLPPLSIPIPIRSGTMGPARLEPLAVVDVVIPAAAQSSQGAPIVELRPVPAAAQTPGRLSKMQIPWAAFPLALYILGVALFALRLIWGWRTMRRLLRSSRPAMSGEGFEFWESAVVSTPLTCGLFSPRVVLPVGWEEWPAEKLQAVLVHERAHVGRKDPLMRFLSRLNCTLFWFHPLAWWLDRKLACIAEFACDDVVVQRSGEPESYAGMLVEMADGVRRRGARYALEGVGILGVGLLEQRVERLLRGIRPQRSSRLRLTVVACLGVGAIYLTAAGRPSSAPPVERLVQEAVGARVPGQAPAMAVLPQAPQAPASKDAVSQAELGTISGQIVDMQGVPVFGVRVRLVLPEGDAVDALSSSSLSGPDGRYRFEGVPPGRYFAVTNEFAIEVIVEPGRNAAAADLVVARDSAGSATVAGLTVEQRIHNYMADPLSRGLVRLDNGSAIPETVTIAVNASTSRPLLTLGLPAGSKARMFAPLGDLRPGNNIVTVDQLPVGYYVKSITFGSLDLTKEPLVLSGNRLPVPTPVDGARIEVVLTRTPPPGTPLGVRVAGRVTNLEYPLDRDPWITLTEVQNNNSRSPRSVTTVYPALRDGHFEINGVPPGRYILHATSEIPGHVDTAGVGSTYGHFRSEPLTLDIADGELSNVELRYEFISADEPKLSVPLDPASIAVVNVVVASPEGTTPEFEIVFTPTRGNAAATSLSVKGEGYSRTLPGGSWDALLRLPQGEYRISVSKLPAGYAVQSVSAGPLDLTEPFLITRGGIADRFTGLPIGIAGRPVSPAIIRLTATPPVK